MTAVQPKMKTRILLAALLAFALASCASPGLTQTKVQQIRLGVTTENDLVQLFGPPGTKWTAYHGNTFIDWIHSDGAGPAGYFPMLGEVSGGLHFDLQELAVIVAPNGRVLSYTIYDSNGATKTEGRMVQEVGARRK